jgi:ABC-type molybdenum transport system ATPase subunit/photorepair protein PhrA
MLSLLTGDHPQSYTQRAPSSLTLFERPRNKWATVQLRREIGIAGIDVLNAWPRGRKMSVWDVIGTGFDGGFVPMGRMRVGSDLDKIEEGRRVERVWEVLNDWWKHSRQTDGEDQVREFSQKTFADLPVGEQSVVILLRAVVGRSKLVLLDEAWSGMDGSTVSAIHEYLRSGV